MAHSSVPVSAAAKGMNKKDERAVAAAAPSRYKGKPSGTQSSGGASYELPNGQWCSKGTYHFNHDQSWGPPMLSGSALARIPTREGPQEQAA
eukprot:1376717-Pleurochrysis_carterae.AAC.1